MILRSWLTGFFLLLCSAAIPADPEAIRSAILGEASASPELDLNDDGVVDVADLVMDVQGDNEISIDERFAMLDLSVEYFESILHLPLAEKNEAMVAWLLEQPLIKDAGIDTEVVWAYFLDGLPIMYADNRRLPGDPPPTQASAFGRPSQIPNQPSAVAVSNQATPGVIEEHPEWFDADQPGSQHVQFINIFRSGYASVDVAPHLQQRLQDVGYSLGSLSTNPNPTLDQFKGGVQNLGLFYITTHAGAGRFEERIGSVPVVGSNFAFQSPVRADRATFAAQNYTDIINKRLTLFIASYYVDENGKKQARMNFGITERFVEHYFSFAPNSLAFIDGCSSSDSRMRNALTSAGAAMVLGWDGAVYDADSAKSTNYLYRGLIGGDRARELDSSLVRPFDIDSIWQAMGRLDLLQDTDGTNLKLHREDDSDFALLVPAIRSVQVFAADGTLHLYGLFGANPGEGGQVLVNETPRAIQSWDRWEIIVDLPSMVYGDVYVIKNGITGNKVALSRYTGTGSAQFESQTTGGFAVANFTLDFRGDFSPFRVKPDDDPIYWQSPEFQAYGTDPEFPKFAIRYREPLAGSANSALLDGLSEITYSYNGELDNTACNDPGTISGGGTLPVVLFNPAPVPPVATEGFAGAIALNLMDNPGVKTYIIGLGAPGSLGTYSNPDCQERHNDMIDLVASGLGAVEIKASFGDLGAVQSGVFVSDEISPFGYTFTTTLTLPTMVPQPVHDPLVYPD